MVEWGGTARETSWKQVDYGPDLGDIPGWLGQAFVRDVVEGVKYIAPPDVDGLRTWVRRTVSGAECFVMPYAGEDPPAHETVLDLQARLAAKRKALKDGDPDLERLDRCIDRFLARVSELHERRAPLGFVQPKSVLFCSDPEGGETVQLPDLGFVFDVDAWVMGRPAWLSAPANDVMFDSSARDRNKSYWVWVTAQNDETFQPLAAEDVRIAARLIAFALAGEGEIRRWCGEGGSLGEVPPPGDGANDTACLAVWDVLHRAIRGEVHSVAELRELLAGDARPSRHFLVRPPRRVGPGERMARRIARLAAAAVAAVLVAWGGYAVYEAVKPERTPICRHVTSWKKTLFPALKDLATQVDSCAASDESKQRFLESLKSYVELLRANPGHGCDESCTERLVAKAEPWIENEVEAIVRNLRERPSRNTEELAVLTKERTRIDELNSLRRESSPPIFQSALKKLDRQLALRGGNITAEAARTEAMESGEHDRP